MNKAQVKVLEGCPASYRATLERAYAGKSRTAAIRAFCLRCVGFQRKEVTACTALGCPLHPYRPYQREGEPDEPADEPA